MTHRPKVSIIIPVYQAEKMIERCLESILAQTFQEYEVLLINDGSTDRTGAICNNYVKKYVNFHGFYQENAGPSAARNRGLDVSTGKYIIFVDSDDYIEKEFLQSFFIKDKHPTNSLVQQGYVREKKSGDKIIFEWPYKTYDQSEFSELFETTELIRRLPFIWSKLFDTSIIKKHDLRFHEDIKYGEDFIFILDYLSHVDSFTIIDQSYYHYLYNEHSLTRTFQKYELELKRFILVNEKLDFMTKKFDLNPKVISFNNTYICRYLIRAFKSMYVESYKKSSKERINILKSLDPAIRDHLIKNLNSPGKFNRMFRFLLSIRLYFLLDLLLYLRVNVLRPV